GGFPHPVLAHAVAHVVAGNLAPWPFHVSGAAAGLWPNPGLIEGLAVALAWDAREGLTPHEWARAMLDLGLMPRLGDLLGLGFLQGNAGRAYTASGSFLRYLGDTRGAEVLRRTYAGGDVA